MCITLGVVDLPRVTNRSRRDLAARRFGGCSLLEWVARRVTEVQHFDHVVVLLSEDDDWMKDLVPADVPVFQSEAEDPLGRLADLCCQWKAEELVRIEVETPFVDPALIEQLVCTARASRCDYVSYRSSDGPSVMKSRLGLVAEFCLAAAVLDADQAAVGPQREHPTGYLLSHPETFRLNFISLPERLDRSDFRLAVDNEEDWDHACDIVDALGVEDLEWQRIALLLAEHPDLRRRMAALNQLAQPIT